MSGLRLVDDKGTRSHANESEVLRALVECESRAARAAELAAEAAREREDLARQLYELRDFEARHRKRRAALEDSALMDPAEAMKLCGLPRTTFWGIAHELGWVVKTSLSPSKRNTRPRIRRKDFESWLRTR